jgi:signal transduction histidine kinase
MNIVIFIFVIILEVIIVYEDNIIVEPKISEQQAVLENLEFDKINISTLVGNGGWIEIQDSNNKVIYQKGNHVQPLPIYTDKELKTIPNESENYELKKHSFADKKGDTYTLILHKKKLSEQEATRLLQKYFIIFISLLLVLYITCINVFVLLLNKKVKKPLSKLEDAMQAFANGERNQIIMYKGPSEFVKICDSFNVMADELKKSEEAQKRLAAEKQKMLADISHDLKTPITNIQGYAKALSDGIIPKDDYDKYLKIIYQKSNTLTELINIFYEYSKIEHPDFKMIMAEESLSEFLRTYIADKYEHICDLGFELEILIPEDKMYYSFDTIQLQRALDNIISNALKHNPSGAVINITLEEQAEYYKINIADNGMGISDEIAKNIFEPFVVGDESRNSKQGSGLGLAITKKIIEKHGGNIRIIPSSETKFKTEFEILLPRN